MPTCNMCLRSAAICCQRQYCFCGPFVKATLSRYRKSSFDVKDERHWKDVEHLEGQLSIVPLHKDS